MSLATMMDDRVLNHPLDVVEEIISTQEWAFDRTSDDEMLVELTGRWSDYRMAFVWMPEHSALLFSCYFGTKPPAAMRGELAKLIDAANQRLWLGHFELGTDEHQPSFRHTMLLRGTEGATSGQMQDMIDVAVTEIDRFYPAFQMMLWGGKSAEEALAVVMFETIGEA